VKKVVKECQLLLRIAKLSSPTGTGGAQTISKRGIQNLSTERSSESVSIAGGNQLTAGGVYDFLGAAQICRYDWNSGPERFDERYPKWFRAFVGLAKDISGCQKLWHIGPLVEKANAVRNSQLHRLALQPLKVRGFLIALHAANLPTNPVRQINHPSQSLEEKRVALVRL
jgi:hypothetical protein